MRPSERYDHLFRAVVEMSACNGGINRYRGEDVVRERFDNLCSADGKMRDGVVIVGRPHNVAVAREMAQYLIDTTVRLAREYSPDRGEKLGFERGCGERLAVRLYRMWEREAMSAAPLRSATGNPGNLPALYQNEAKLVAEFKAQLGLRKAKTRGSSLNEHSVAGAEAAEGVSLNRQIGQTRNSRMIGRS